jgi:hypothetical protein
VADITSKKEAPGDADQFRDEKDKVPRVLRSRARRGATDLEQSDAVRLEYRDLRALGLFNIPHSYSRALSICMPVGVFYAPQTLQNA